MREGRTVRGEREAERIYELLREGRMGRKTFAFNARSLELHHPLGGLYLRFLLFSALGKRRWEETNSVFGKNQPSSP